MRRFARACALLGAIGVVGFACAQTTIQFSEAGLTPGFGPDPWFPGSPKGTELNTQFLGLGALFTTTNGISYASNKNFAAGTAALPWDDFLAVNSIPPLGNPAMLSVTFWDPNNANTFGWVEGGSISVKVSDQNSRPTDRVIIQTYDTSGTLAEQWILGAYESTAIFSIGNIHEVRFIDNGADGFVMDDLTFGSVTIAPEPGTIAALGVGIAAVLARKRRKR